MTTRAATDEEAPVAIDVDAFVREVWDIELAYDEDGWVNFDLGSDQWFGMTITCEHGNYSGVSRGSLDPSRAFSWALRKFKEAHA